MGFFNDILGSTEPVKTATPNVKTPLNKSQPIETLTPAVMPPALATPTPIPTSPWMDSTFVEGLKWHETRRNTPEAQMSAIGDTGAAHGWLQQHEINVNNANEILERKRRIEAQNWARSKKIEIGSSEYKEYLNSLPPAAKYKASDRTDPVKSMEIYDTNMKDLVPKLEKMLGRKLTKTELARAHNAGTVERFKINKRYGERYDESQKDIPKKEEAKKK